MTLSQDAYVQSSHTVCPACGSFDVWVGSLQWHGYHVERYVSCCACRADWFERYPLAGYTQLERDDKSILDEEE